MALAGAPTLIAKEFREHGFSMLLLIGGFVATLLIAHAQNSHAVFAMSPLEILLLSVTLVLPLITFIMGNRLISSEYLGSTRQFVEALPIKPAVFLLIKYLFGLLFVCGLVAIAITYAWAVADAGDALDKKLLTIVTIKILSVIFFVWSVVFCFSFFGFLRLALYVTLGLIVLTLISYPEFDQKTFGPFALLDSSVFAFERDQLPVKAALQTLFMGAVFSIAGFMLPLLREGSLIEALSKPLSRGNLVVLAVIGVGVFATLGALFERWEKEPYEFSGDHVLSSTDPAVSILYLSPEYETQSQRLLESMGMHITAFKTELNVQELPTVRIALDTELSGDDLNDIRFSSADGVLIRANYVDYDSYSMAVMQTNAIHQVIQSVSGERRTFEPYHWLTDGISRWWVESAIDESRHEAELYARAIYGLNTIRGPVDLAGNWQWIAEYVGYPTAEAMAYSAMKYLEQEHGRDQVLALANAVLVPTVSENVVGVIKDRVAGVRKPFLQLFNVELDDFFNLWQQWLQEQTNNVLVAELLGSLPSIQGVIRSEVDEAGVHRLTGDYQLKAADSWPAGLNCVMQHSLISPFDYEIGYFSGEHDKQACDKGNPVHTVSSYYGNGDRVFVALEYHPDNFHQALRVGTKRMAIQW